MFSFSIIVFLFSNLFQRKWSESLISMTAGRCIDNLAWRLCITFQFAFMKSGFKWFLFFPLVLSNNVFETKRSYFKRKSKCRWKKLSDWRCNKNINKKRKCSEMNLKLKNLYLSGFLKNEPCNVPISEFLLNQKALKSV